MVEIMNMNQDEELKIIEGLFHDLIGERAEPALSKPHNKDLVLPKLSMDLLNSKEWFPISGMYGGFSYYLFIENNELTLICESLCRIVWGSGQRHKITKNWLCTR